MPTRGLAQCRAIPGRWGDPMFTSVEAAGCTNASRRCSSEGKPLYGGFFSCAEPRQLIADGSELYPHSSARAPLERECMPEVRTR